jgi:ubiquinone/menaquinone biosynthesis C-methylase UbiE
VNTHAAEAPYQDLDVAEGYDAARFFGLRGRYNNWKMRRVLETVVKVLPPGAVVLDAGCGTGRVVEYLMSASVQVVAMDISSEMLAVARGKARLMLSSLGLRFLRADAVDLPIRSKSVDVVFSVRLLPPLDRERRIRTLREIARVTRGPVVVEYRNITTWPCAARRAVRRWLGQRGVRRSTTSADVAAELKTCGLVVERFYFMNRWWSGSVLVVALSVAGA